MTADIATAEALLIKEVSKGYPGVQALNRIGLSVRAGAIHAIAGQNGAGKTTLVKILSGAEAPDSGSIQVGGQRVRFHGPQDAQAAGIQAIYQELSLVPQLSVAENVLLGHLPRRRFPGVDWADMRRQAEQALALVGLELDVRQPVSRFSVAEQQGVEIAKALHRNARILLLDEPTSALPAPDVQRLFSVLRNLAHNGMTLLYISHRIEELFELCESVTVLRNGQ
jgi:ribose transport system ATP-binding protein